MAKAAAKATRASMSRALKSLKPSLMRSRARAKATAAATAMAIHCAVLRAGGMACLRGWGAWGAQAGVVAEAAAVAWAPAG